MTLKKQVALSTNLFARGWYLIQIVCVFIKKRTCEVKLTNEGSVLIRQRNKK